MENFLTSLMKEKYGVTKSSPLKFTEKDTLYTSFRKLADHIYKNGEWNSQDEIQAVDTMVRNYNGFGVGLEKITVQYGRNRGENASVTVRPLSDTEKSTVGRRLEGMTGYTSIVEKQSKNKEKPNDIRKTFVILDPDNRVGTKHNQVYYYRGDAQRGNLTYYALGNMNRAIGYDKLQRDILKEYDRKANEMVEKGISRRDMESFLENLSNPKYSGKKWQNNFQKNPFGELTDEFLETLARDESVRYWQVPPTKEEIEGTKHTPFKWRDLTDYPESNNKLNLDEAPYILVSNDGLSKTFLSPSRIEQYRKQNQIVNFVKDYMDNTYDIILQREYEQDIDKQTRASAWQTKKNINKETQEIMDTTSLKEHFKFIELDNDVDLKLFHQFEVEMKRIHSVLPQTETQFDLRLRKLGNYNALGLYVPNNNTIAIDFRDYDDDIGGIGIQSFIHEYGHALDYNYKNDGKMMSVQENFRPLVTRYRENIERLAKNTYVSKKSNYYGTPTEVFARAFEIYVSDLGLKSSFIKSEEKYQQLTEYQLFDEFMKSDLHDYFDQEFPSLKESVKLLNQGKNGKKQMAEEQTRLFENLVDVERAAEPTQIGEQQRTTQKGQEVAAASKTNTNEPTEPKTTQSTPSFAKMKEIAKSRSILDVAGALGMELFESSRGELRWTEHNSFVIFPDTNSYRWFSKAESGDVIQMVQTVRGDEGKETSFKEAIAFLNDPNLQEVDMTKFETRKPKEPFRYLFKDHDSIDVAKDYLVNQRGLSSETVEFFKQQGSLAEATRIFSAETVEKMQERIGVAEEDRIQSGHREPVVVFKSFDTEGNIVGASLQGIEEHYELHGERGRLKEIVLNSEGNTGFSVDIGEPKKLIFFESAIDLMSYYEVKTRTNELSDARLVSMDGLKKNTIDKYFKELYFPEGEINKEQKGNFIEQLNEHLGNYENPREALASKEVEIVLAVDNDAAGMKFIESMKSELQNIPISTDLPALTEGNEKMDWNQFLQENGSIGRAETINQENDIIIKDNKIVTNSNGREISIERIGDERLYSEVEYHSEGLDIRVFADPENKAQSTTMIMPFDLNAHLLDEETWIHRDFQNEAAQFENDLLIDDRLNPKFLNSFIEKWNKYKMENNQYRDRPIDEGLIVFDMKKTLSELGITEFGEQLPLPEGELLFNSQPSKESLRNNLDSEKIYSYVESYESGVRLRFTNDQTNLHDNTVMLMTFDNNGYINGEGWVQEGYSNQAELIKNELVNDNHLNPKYLASFLEHWNNEMRVINQQQEKSPDENVVTFEQLQALDANKEINWLEQVQLPEGELILPDKLSDGVSGMIPNEKEFDLLKNERDKNNWKSYLDDIKNGQTLNQTGLNEVVQNGEEKIYSQASAHETGVQIRFLTDPNNIADNTILLMNFDLNARMTGDWIDENYLVEATQIKNELLTNNSLNPKYLTSFIENWNELKRESNQFNEEPIESNLISFDNLKTVDESGYINNFEQKPLPEGEINLGQFSINQSLSAFPEETRQLIKEYAEKAKITSDFRFDYGGEEFEDYKVMDQTFFSIDTHTKPYHELSEEDVYNELTEALMNGKISLSKVYDEEIIKTLSPAAIEFWTENVNVESKELQQQVEIEESVEEYAAMHTLKEEEKIIKKEEAAKQEAVKQDLNLQENIKETHEKLFDYSKATPEAISKQALQLIRNYSEDPKEFEKYMDFMSKFPKLSPRNVALIQEQWQGANAVATFAQWQAVGKKLNLAPEDVNSSTRTFRNNNTNNSQSIVMNSLSVKAGQKSQITLFRPIMNEIIPVLDKNGTPVKKDNGKLLYKNVKQATADEKQLIKEGKLKKYSIQAKDPETGKGLFTTYKVFELSQTNLKPEAYPKVMPNRHYNFNTDDVKLLEVTQGLQEYSKAIGVPIYMDDRQVLGNAKGAFYPNEQKILLNPLNTEGEKIGTTIHELAHATLHNPKFTDKYRTDSEMPRSRQELEAEMTSFLVSKHFGLDTTEKSIGYMAAWTKNLKNLDDKQLNSSLSRVHKTTRHMIDSIEKHTKPFEQSKTKNIDTKQNKAPKTISR